VKARGSFTVNRGLTVVCVLLLVAAFLLASTAPAWAADLSDSVKGVIKLGRLALLAVLLFVAFRLFFGHQLVQAIVVLVIGALVYVALDPEATVLQTLGDALLKLLSLK